MVPRGQSRFVEEIVGSFLPGPDLRDHDLMTESTGPFPLFLLCYSARLEVFARPSTLRESRDSCSKYDWLSLGFLVAFSVVTASSAPSTLPSPAESVFMELSYPLSYVYTQFCSR